MSCKPGLGAWGGHRGLGDMTLGKSECSSPLGICFAVWWSCTWDCATVWVDICGFYSFLQLSQYFMSSYSLYLRVGHNPSSVHSGRVLAMLLTPDRSLQVRFGSKGVPRWCENMWCDGMPCWAVTLCFHVISCRGMFGRYVRSHVYISVSSRCTWNINAHIPGLTDCQLRCICRLNNSGLWMISLFILCDTPIAVWFPSVWRMP